MTRVGSQRHNKKKIIYLGQSTWTAAATGNTKCPVKHGQPAAIHCTQNVQECNIDLGTIVIFHIHRGWVLHVAL